MQSTRTASSLGRNPPRGPRLSLTMKIMAVKTVPSQMPLFWRMVASPRSRCWSASQSLCPSMLSQKALQLRALLLGMMNTKYSTLAEDCSSKHVYVEVPWTNFKGN
ncbi:uncharacterized protein WM277_018043 isoform 2-T2 [Molossus nigricans]